MLTPPLEGRFILEAAAGDRRAMSSTVTARESVEEADIAAVATASDPRMPGTATAVLTRTVELDPQRHGYPPEGPMRDDCEAAKGLNRAPARVTLTAPEDLMLAVTRMREGLSIEKAELTVATETRVVMRTELDEAETDWNPPAARQRMEVDACHIVAVQPVQPISPLEVLGKCPIPTESVTNSPPVDAPFDGDEGPDSTDGAKETASEREDMGGTSHRADMVKTSARPLPQPAANLLVIEV